MKTFTAYGIQLWNDLADLLNDIIRQQGTLKIDDRQIWDGVLHRWNNEDWIMVIALAERLIRRHPTIAQPGHAAAIEEIKRLILTHYRKEHRVMDIRQIGMDHKRAAWRGICTLRELWNAVQKIDLPIEIRTRSFKRTTLWKPRS
jgi:hypothetical protein